MNTIEEMLTGQIEISEFIALLKSDPTLQNEIRNLVPPEAAHNRSHPLWEQQRISYMAFQDCGYDFLRFVCRFSRLDGSIGENLNLWGPIYRVYSYYHPDLPYTMMYHDMFGLYLDAARDCFEGPEVESIVEKIVKDAMEIKTKGKRRQRVKEDVERVFHVTDKKRPRWIQGAEWPMGVNSPMKYISQKRTGELVEYFFEDVDTGACRTVEQFY